MTDTFDHEFESIKHSLTKHGTNRENGTDSEWVTAAATVTTTRLVTTFTAATSG